MLSFVLITGGQRPREMELVLQSIKAECAEEHEIIIVGEGLRHECDKFIEWQEDSKKIMAKYNAGAEASKGDIIFFGGDDMMLAPGWREAWQAVTKDWQVAGMKFLTMDGKRSWDWSLVRPHQNICYKRTEPGLYIGGIILAKREVWEKYRWDETRLYEQAGDVEYCHRLSANGIKLTTLPELITYNTNPYHNPGVTGEHTPGCLCVYGPKYTVLKMQVEEARNVEK
jgi:hypothetical protein